jgi:hypothetical protein
MNKIRLVHLTMVGPSVETASVEFDPGLTVIHGASETGKSYMVGAIDFMLGSRSAPKQIVESTGYTHALLGIAIGDEGTTTLMRSVEGGPFSLYHGDVREIPQGEPQLVLAAQHSEKNFDNLSNYLLRELELSGSRLKKNQKNQTTSLSFRNLSPHCLVDETSMQSALSPILTGQYVTRTTERAVFKLLLEGEDDTALSEVAPADQAMSKGKLEVLERIVTETELSLAEAPEKIDIEEQLERLKETLSGMTVLASDLARQRDGLLRTRAATQGDLGKTIERLAELGNLSARFTLLRQKYESDLDRLEMVDEVGTLLGYFTPGVCVFCGAEVEHQNAEVHTHAEATEIATSVAGERARTRGLLSDLLLTIVSIGEERDAAETERASLQTDLTAVEQSLAQLDSQLSPVNEELEELLESRSRAERNLGLYEQLNRLTELRAQYTVGNSESASAPTTPRSSGAPNDMALREFAGTVARVLADWQLLESSPVHFDKEIDDVVVAGRARPNRGKGMRSILHAAFKVAIFNYCFDRALPHPGFLVLDSPLVTYREPYGPPQEDEIELDAVSGYVADALFRYLATDFPGQTIVLENVDPPSDLSEKSARTIRFTKSAEGRYGFFPVRAGLSAAPDSG